jgi:hypothetical protein
MIAANQLPVAMTVAEFLDWNPQDSDRWELIDGTPGRWLRHRPVTEQSKASRHG